MNLYTNLTSPDMIPARASLRRKLYIILGVASFVTFVLYLRAHSVQGDSLLDNDSRKTTRPVNVLDEDEWEAPDDWDPIRPVWTEFDRHEEQYESGTKNLTENLKTSKHIAHEHGKGRAEKYNPYPDYESQEYKSRYAGNFVSCIGPRGVPLNQSDEDAIYAYDGRYKDFPSASLGSGRGLGFDEDVCFERYGRFGAYGVGADAKQKIDGWIQPEPLNWDEVDWGTLQRRCVQDNANRFDLKPRPMPGDEGYLNTRQKMELPLPHKKERSAVLFRTYHGFQYTTDAIRTMRSIISELSLGSGGEFEAFLLVQVKDTRIPIFDDPSVYQQVLELSVPREFWNMTVLWNEALWGQLYPKIPPDIRWVHLSQWLPIQWFASVYPNFDHYWNWEMDIRYTGHHYHLIDKVDEWGKKQPRKGMWERNERFYIPRVHGEFDSNYRDIVQSIYQTKNAKGDTKDETIWGPFPPPGQPLADYDETPPAERPTPIQDNYEWGVGEDTDMFTFLPMFNPDTTHYVNKHVYFNYPGDLKPYGPPRRGTIITLYRMSHRLISTMHLENVETGRHMGSEMWPQSVALHHGFKALYAPHPIYMDRKWPAQALDFIFNNGDQAEVINAFKDMSTLGEGSGGWESVFGLDREHNFIASTWYYRTMFSSRLYKRFLGWNVSSIGGPTWEKTHGRYCLPALLLHQVKDMEDPEVQEAAEAKSKAEAEQKKKEADAGVVTTSSASEEKSPDKAAEEVAEKAADTAAKQAASGDEE